MNEHHGCLARERRQGFGCIAEQRAPGSRTLFVSPIFQDMDLQIVATVDLAQHDNAGARDKGPAATIFAEDCLDFAGRGQMIERYDQGTGGAERQMDNNPLRAVGRHEQDRLARHNAAAHEPGRQAPRVIGELGKGPGSQRFAPDRDQCRAIAEARDVAQESLKGPGYARIGAFSRHDRNGGVCDRSI